MDIILENHGKNPLLVSIPTDGRTISVGIGQSVLVQGVMKSDIVPISRAYSNNGLHISIVASVAKPSVSVESVEIVTDEKPVRRRGRQKVKLNYKE